MDFIYYVIRKKDMVIIQGAEDMVGAINIAQQANYACLIMQGCVITEVGQDFVETDKMFEEPELENRIEDDIYNADTFE